MAALQNRNVISVVLGDYHFGALTSTGKLLTWGDYSRGALGLGDPTEIDPGQPGGYRTEAQRRHALEWRTFPPAVTEPAEVRFDYEEHRPRKRFCFAATAAGWHMGALIIDLEVREPLSVNDIMLTGKKNHVKPDDPDDEEEATTMPGRFPTSAGPSTPTNPPGIPRPSIFRIGFGGRGATNRWARGHRGL